MSYGGVSKHLVRDQSHGEFVGAMVVSQSI